MFFGWNRDSSVPCGSQNEKRDTSARETVVNPSPSLVCSYHRQTENRRRRCSTWKNAFFDLSRWRFLRSWRINAWVLFPVYLLNGRSFRRVFEYFRRPRGVALAPPPPPPVRGQDVIDKSPGDRTRLRRWEKCVVGTGGRYTYQRRVVPVDVGPKVLVREAKRSSDGRGFIFESCV